MRVVVRRSLGVLCAAALGVLGAARAYAFQNPEQFAADAARGGGGDRYFTGSPLDAYTCEVCHTSVEEVPLHVYGLPDSNYVLGAVYHVTIDWPDELSRVALTMEMTDRSGRALGTWSESNPAVLAEADRCALAADPPSGIRLLARDGPRLVVSAIDCGQRQVSLDWYAPNAADLAPGTLVPDAWFSGSVVASNGNGKLAGDSVGSFARGIAAPYREPVFASEVLARCSTLAPTAAHGGGFGLLAPLAMCWLLAHRRRRAGRRAQQRERAG